MIARPRAIEVEHASVVYGGERVLDDVTLEVAEGEFVGIVGPNGSGKTTLLRAILGLAPLASGSVKLFGAPTSRFADWARLGYVPQNAGQVDAAFPATALEVALLGRVARRGLFRWFGAADRAKAREALDEVGVADLADRLVGTLSGGQRQRVLLAKALAGDPDLLILDEPTTGVDPDARAEFYELLDHLNHEHGHTVLIVSHDPETVQASAHRIVLINRGIAFDGSPAEFAESAAHVVGVSHGQAPPRHRERAGGSS